MEIQLASQTEAEVPMNPCPNRLLLPRFILAFLGSNFAMFRGKVNWPGPGEAGLGRCPAQGRPKRQFHRD